MFARSVFCCCSVLFLCCLHTSPPLPPAFLLSPLFLVGVGNAVHTSALLIARFRRSTHPDLSVVQALLAFIVSLRFSVSVCFMLTVASSSVAFLGNGKRKSVLSLFATCQRTPGLLSVVRASHKKSRASSVGFFPLAKGPRSGGVGTTVSPFSGGAM